MLTLFSKFPIYSWHLHFFLEMDTWKKKIFQSFFFLALWPYLILFRRYMLCSCGVVIFFSFGSCFFFHNVPSLQQNIHIKTLADDMVRCSAQLWCTFVLFDMIMCFVQCCMGLNSTEMYGWIKSWDQIKMNIKWNMFQVYQPSCRCLPAATLGE